MLEFFILGYAPALFIMWYVYHKDRIEPEPKIYVILTFLFSSIISTSLAMFLEKPLTGIYLFIFAPFIEEFTKMFALLIPYRRRMFDGVMDGVVYGVAAGLGFASFENLVYGLSYGYETALIRALLTPVAHSAFTSITGVGLGLRSEGKTASVIPYLVLAGLFHLAWNISAMTGVFTLTLFGANLLILYILIKIGMREDVQKIEQYIIRKF